jgi:hypothetical protein
MPRRHDDLFGQIATFQALHAAAHRAVKGKRKKPAAASFFANLEGELLALERQLRAGEYQPGRYVAFEVNDPKKRIVSAAPFRDRVVHHALCAVVEPIFEAGFIDHTFANRTGKGTHSAIEAYERYRDRRAHVLRCDIYRYFPAIDHTILKSEFRRRIICPTCGASAIACAASAIGGGRERSGSAMSMRARGPGSLTLSMQIHGAYAMRSSGAAGLTLPQPLKPGRPLVAVSFAAVPGTTIHRTSARPTATGTPPTTGTTTTDFGSGARFPPEPARSRSHRVSTKRPGPFMMSTVGAEGACARYHGGACLGSLVSDRRRRLFQETLALPRGLEPLFLP